MRDWESFLDKFLRDTELPVLTHAGTVTHDEALDWANEQYEAFAQRRISKAEATAEGRYLDDLRDSARIVEAERKKLMPKKIVKKKGFRKNP